MSPRVGWQGRPARWDTRLQGCWPLSQKVNRTAVHSDVAFSIPPWEPTTWTLRYVGGSGKAGWHTKGAHRRGGERPRARGTWHLRAQSRAPQTQPRWALWVPGIHPARPPGWLAPWGAAGTTGWAPPGSTAASPGSETPPSRKDAPPHRRPAERRPALSMGARPWQGASALLGTPPALREPWVGLHPPRRRCLLVPPLPRRGPRSSSSTPRWLLAPPLGWLEEVREEY